jgi:hypothetical protein
MSTSRAAMGTKWGAATLCVGVALGLLAVGVSPAAAVPATATITGGPLAMTAPASASFAATLTGADQDVTASQVVNVTDSTGTGAGWNVTLTSTTFTAGGSTLPDSSVTDTGAVGACASSVTCVLGTNAVVYPVTVPSSGTAPTAVKILNAALDTGLGSQDWTHSMSLRLLASAKAGTYTSTWTYSLVSAP